MSFANALIEEAQRARERAYAPYSGFFVGAAVETLDGAIVTGANVENASYSLSLCAERAALVRAVAEGHRRFRAIAVAGPRGATTAPCGACRQFIAEFGRDIAIAFTSADGIVETTIELLLPYPFTADALSPR